MRHCCPCGAGRSFRCSDDLDDASSCAREDGRESDQHDTGVLGVLAYIFGKPGNVIEDLQVLIIAELKIASCATNNV